MLICLLQFFFTKYSNNFFTTEIINNICLWDYILKFLITESSSDQFGMYPLANMFLYFKLLTWWPTLNLGSLLLTSFLKSIYVLSLTSTGLLLLFLKFLHIHYAYSIKTFKFTKEIFVSTLMFFGSLSSVNTLQCVSRNNQQCKVRPEIVKVNNNH